MNIYKHVYAIFGLGIVLAALSVANSKALVRSSPTQSVLVTNTNANPVRTSPVGNTSVVGSVGITNGVDSPLPVRNVDAVTHVPISISGGVSFADGQVEQGGSVFYTVPAGKRLVVQSMIAKSFQLPQGQKLVDVSLGAVSDTSYTIPVQFQGTDDDGYDHFAGAFAGTIYFYSGNQIRVLATRDLSTGFAAASVAINGYLENN